MSKYRTCFNCAVDPATCPTRAKITAAIAGIGVTSLKFKCVDRRPLYQPGQRVSVRWLVPPLPNDPYSDYENYMHEAWPATVIQETGSKFLIRVDDVPSDEGTPARDYIKSETLYCKVTAGILKPLDEPLRSVCALCGDVDGVDPSGCFGRMNIKCMINQNADRARVMDDPIMVAAHDKA